MGLPALTNLSLFSGAGGLEIAARWTGRVRTACYVEIDPYAQAVLQTAIRSGELDDAPIWDDIKTFDATAYRGVEIVSGGFPCQPASSAGRRKGTSDERWLWPEFARVIREARPRFVLAENVPGLLSVNAGAGFGEVLRDLAQAGYDAEWCVRSAADVGAPHLRERVWIVAHAQRAERGALTKGRHEPDGHDARRKEATSGAGERSEDMADTAGSRRPSWESVEGGAVWDEARRAEPERRGAYVANAKRKGCGTTGNADPAETPCGRTSTGLERSGWRPTKPDMGGTSDGLATRLDGTGRGRPPLVHGWPEGWEDGVPRVAKGVPFRVGRLRCLGNGVVPQQALPAWERILELAGMKRKR